MGSRTSTISQKNASFINFHKVVREVVFRSVFLMREVDFRSVFHALSQKLKILAIPNVLAHENSYEHGFVKNCDGHKFAQSHARSEVSIGFSCTVSKIQNTGHSQSTSP
ncbi:hypothetical protein BHE74_00044254 [Ensete ventricosum]|nr:hypothetical protein BHE74_00044254 [Ensete ventricosum]